MTDEQIERAARAAHEANRAYCQAIGDHTQLTWEAAPEWQKASERLGVQFILENPDASPSASHDSWLAEKIRDGWKYGAVRDAEAKTHPCFVPYEKLPESQKAKDAIFGAVVRGVVAHYGAAT